MSSPFKNSSRRQVKVWFYSIHSIGPIKERYTSPPPPPTRLLWEAFSHAAIAEQRLFTHISTAVYSQVLFIQPNELGRRGENENAQSSKRQQRGFVAGLSRMRVRHSTTEPPRSDRCISSAVRQVRGQTGWPSGDRWKPSTLLLADLT